MIIQNVTGQPIRLSPKKIIKPHAEMQVTDKEGKEYLKIPNIKLKPKKLKHDSSSKKVSV